MPTVPDLHAAFGALLGQPLKQAAPVALLSRFVEAPEIAEQRLLAYRRNVLGNWTAALTSTFPVLASLLGTEAFKQLGADFVTSHPSRDGDLNRYGAEFPDYLSSTPWTLDYPYLPDVARLEWALQEAYFAADPESFDFSALAALPGERQTAVRLLLWPGLCLIASPYPIAAIWQAHQLNEAAARDQALARIPWHVAEGGENFTLATRNTAGEPVVYAMTTAEATFFQALSAGKPLSEAIQQAHSTDPDFNPGTCLSDWVAQSIVTGFHDPLQEPK